MSKQNDIVIPVSQSKINHLDLKYTLRSIEKNVRNYRDIWVIGEKPSWASDNLKCLPHSDASDPKWKEKNIMKKFQAACITKGITDNFIATNDDIFILEEIDAVSYPFYYKGTVTDSWINNRSNYRKTCNHTRKWLERRGFKDLNFDTHTPIIYNKNKFLSSFNDIDWETPWGYLVKTHYCAVNKVEPVFMADLKFKKKYTLDEVRKKVKGRQVVSCTDAPMKAGLLEFLQETFSQPSKYEK